MWLDIYEVASEMGVSPATVKKLALQNRFSRVRNMGTRGQKYLRIHRDCLNESEVFKAPEVLKKQRVRALDQNTFLDQF